MKDRIFIIPGNPCCKHFYSTWIQEMRKDFPSLEATCHIFPIFDQNLTPNEYIQNVVGFYEQKLTEFAKKDKVHVVAHSIGGFIACELLKKKDSNISKVSLIFPFLGQPERPGKRVLRLAYGLSRLKPLSKFIVKNKELLHFIISDSRFVTKRELANSLAFAKYEYLYFNEREFDYESIGQFKDKVEFIYNDRDIWCSKKTTQSLKRLLKSHYINADHEFIIHKSQRQKMINHLLPHEN